MLSRVSSRVSAQRVGTLPTRLVSTTAVRRFQFSSSKFVEILGQPQPVPDNQHLRSCALQYLKSFDASSWSTDPVHTILNGEHFTDGTTVDTINAFNKVNGKQILATQATVDRVLEHVKNFKPSTDLREVVREVEAIMLSSEVGALIGNQNLDFGKQDGVTEIEESLQANSVERKLNDLLLEDEANGIVQIDRSPAYVGCVSNFSNFLDLCRKVLRNIELGVPVVVLSRSNTTQHMFRWFQLLEKHFKARSGFDMGMITYLSCDVASQRYLFAKTPNCPLYLTGSRPIAKAIKELLPRTFASTGGPNTMVNLECSKEMMDAMRLSCSIENSGQCTALRHLVVPKLDANELIQCMSSIPVVSSARDSLENGEFAGIIRESTFSLEEGYTQIPGLPAAFKIAGTPPAEIDEKWRQVYVDVTQVDNIRDHTVLDSLANWLVKQQPISLAVNGDASPFPVMMRLFERTALCVYTLGSPGAPALTAQARPQEGEVFGEFPPRRELADHTRFPVLVPSSTPSYNTHYTERHLLSPPALPKRFSFCSDVVAAIKDPKKRGYANILLNYLVDACGPHPGHGKRTSLFGWQRPPLNGQRTVIRCGADQDVDDVILFMLPFLVTNARSQCVISCDPAHEKLRSTLLVHNRLRGIPVVFESDISPQFSGIDHFNVIERPAVDTNDAPLASMFLSTLFAMGHIKTTAQNSVEFLETFSRSSKWLALMSG